MISLFFLIFSNILNTESLSTKFEEEDGVIILNDDNYQEAIKRYQPLLIKFYAPWCGHCQLMAPHFARAAQTLKNDITPTYLAKIDSTIYTNAAKFYDIQGFPSFKYFKNGDEFEYDSSQRADDEIIAWVRKKSGPLIETLTSSTEVIEFSKSSDVAVVFFGLDGDLYYLYKELAKAYDDLKFGECQTKECQTHFNVRTGNIIMFRKFDIKNAELITSIYTAHELKAFIDQNSHKDVVEFDDNVAELIFSKSVPGLFFYRSKGSEDEKQIDVLANSVANELKGKIQIVISDIQDGIEQRLAEYIGVTNADLPCVRIHDTRREIKKYNLNSELTKENVIQFVKDWLDRKLSLSFKSEDESITEHSTGPVVALVGSNFEKIVYDPTKDVLVEFYAPWCSNCQKLIPIYENLASDMKSTNPNIIISKIDATANDIKGLEVHGFPTFKLYRKHNQMDFYYVFYIV